MRQFDIFYWKPPDWKEAHPAVVVSPIPTARARNWMWK
jgi:hypothetical protein